MEERDAVITFRIESSLKEKLEAACRDSDTTVSQFLRAAIREKVGKGKAPVKTPAKPKASSELAEKSKTQLKREARLIKGRRR